MKKQITLMSLAVLAIFLIGFVSACEGLDCPVEYTEVKGVIYLDLNGDGDYNSGDDSVANAKVEVTCNHKGVETVKKATTNKKGEYSVTYHNEARCDYGDEVTVTAYKKGIGVGEEDGEIDKTYTYNLGYYWCKTLNIGIVNVPLVPEFGVFVGALTLISAIGVFFMVRRK